MHSALTLILVTFIGIVGLVRCGDYGIPFPVRVNQNDYIKNVNLLRCGGDVNYPVVINTKNYPLGNSGKDRCVWKIKTRKCFVPKLKMVSRNGYDSYWTAMDAQFGKSTISFMNNPNGYVWYAPTSEGTLTFENRVGWGGYGFQMLIDFVPRTTPECLAEFTEQSALTCVPIPTTNGGFNLQSIEYPSPAEPGSACKQIFPMADDLKTYEVKITANVTEDTRLELNDMFTSETFYDVVTSKTILITKPFNVLFRADKSVSTPGFKMEFKTVQALAPCATTVMVGAKPVVIKNPYSRTAKISCAIKFESSIANKRLSFNFSNFTLSLATEAGQLYKDYPTMNEYDRVNGNSGTKVTSSPALLLYKAVGTNTLWQLTISTVD